MQNWLKTASCRSNSKPNHQSLSFLKKCFSNYQPQLQIVNQYYHDSNTQSQSLTSSKQSVRIDQEEDYTNINKKTTETSKELESSNNQQKNIESMKYLKSSSSMNESLKYCNKDLRESIPLKNKNKIQSSSNSKIRYHSNYSDMLKNNSRSDFNQSKIMSKLKTTGNRKKSIKQWIISVIQYKSNQIGISGYNINSGEIYLAQIIQRMTYIQIISTINRFYPYIIIYSNTQQNSPLIKKLHKTFLQTTFRMVKRMNFDETKGFRIYSERNNKEESNPDNKFIAYSALNALINYIESQGQSKIQYKTLNIKWHYPENVLIIQNQTIFDLQIFLNGETKKTENSLIENFKCETYGGTRMLRANILQPLCQKQKIEDRLNVVEFLLKNNKIYQSLKQEVGKYKLYQPITVKFIQNLKPNDSKSIKSFIYYILLISNFVNSISILKNKLADLSNQNLKIINSFSQLLNDNKISEIKQLINQNFQSEVLNTFQNTHKTKKDNYIFLVKLNKINNEFAHISRVTYSHTLEDIFKIYETIKAKTSINFKLNHNQNRGYYLSCKNNVDLKSISLKIADDIIQISKKGKYLYFSTSVLVSMNNRLKQNQKKIIFQSEKKICEVVREIQDRLQILFQINYSISILDMLLAFVGFIKYFKTVKFTRPIFIDYFDTIDIQDISMVWTQQRFFKLSKKFSISINQTKNVVLLQKSNNSYQQINKLSSIGYLVILSQIGCFVPAEKFKTNLFHILASKFRINETIENSLSHFQSEVHSLNNIIQNVSDNPKKCLVLMDEIVKGTSYEQQISIGLGFLKNMSQLNGFLICLSSDELLIKQSVIFPYLKLIKEQEKLQQSLLQLLQQISFDEKFIQLCKNIVYEQISIKCDNYHPSNDKRSRLEQVISFLVNIPSLNRQYIDEISRNKLEKIRRQIKEI